jgi:UDP-glucose 4-epimerase
MATDDRGCQLPFPGGSVALVTGGAGFIGTPLCKRLAAAGVTVHSASRRAQSATEAVNASQVDLADFSSTSRLLDRVRPDYVFHLASHVQGAPDLKHVLPAFRDNLQTTVNLLTAVAERGCRRVVLAGSFMEPALTTSGLVPTSPYAAAKSASSLYARMFETLYRVPIATARLFMVYGPGQQDLGKLIPYVIGSLLKGEAPSISSGRRLIDWVYVDDVIEGLLGTALSTEAAGRAVDIGSGHAVATADLVALIHGLVGSSPAPRLGALEDRPLEPTGTASIDETFRVIGWAPRTKLDEGLIRTIDFYKTAGASA